MEQASIPYIAHESMMARLERITHRQWIVILVLILALVASNVGWIMYESQWEVVEETNVSQEAETDNGDAVNRYVGGDASGEIETDGDN